MINLSLDELRLIAQIGNISDYENKSKEDLIKALSETKPKLETPKPEPKIVKTNKRKLKKLWKDFDELKQKFSKKEIKKYRKAFYVAENKISFWIRNFNEKSLMFKRFNGNIDSVDYDDLDNYDYNHDFADDDEYRKKLSIRTLFDRDYYKPIRTDGGFSGRRNNYIEYMSKGDRYENLH